MCFTDFVFSNNSPMCFKSPRHLHLLAIMFESHPSHWLRAQHVRVSAAVTLKAFALGAGIIAAGTCTWWFVPRRLFLPARWFPPPPCPHLSKPEAQPNQIRESGSLKMFAHGKTFTMVTWKNWVQRRLDVGARNPAQIELDNWIPEPCTNRIGRLNPETLHKSNSAIESPEPRTNRIGRLNPGTLHKSWIYPPTMSFKHTGFGDKCLVSKKWMSQTFRFRKQ